MRCQASRYSTLRLSTFPPLRWRTLPKFETYAEHAPEEWAPSATVSGGSQMPWHSFESVHDLPLSVAGRSHIFGLSGYGRPRTVQLPPARTHSASDFGMTGFRTSAPKAPAPTSAMTTVSRIWRGDGRIVTSAPRTTE